MNRVLGILLFLTFPAFAANVQASIEPAHDISALLAMMGMILAILVVLIVIGLCLAVAAITAVCLLVLIALGIISTSALTGILRRKFSSGLRALHYQACAAIALPVGAGLAWLAVWLFDSTSHLPVALAIGSVSGICAGLTIAHILDRAAMAAFRYFERKRANSKRIRQSHPGASS